MTTTVFTAILSLFALAGSPDAPTSRASGDEGRRSHGGLCEKLACTDTQKAEIDGIRAAMRTETADERAAITALRAKLHAAKAVDPRDAALIDGLRAEIKVLHVAMKEARTESREAITALLTPAQKEQLAALKAKHGDRKDKAKRGGKHKGKHQGDKAKRGDGGQRDAKGDVARAGRHGNKARGLARRGGPHGS